ncbi:MAG: hypothetical protein HRT72_00300 [Flavobacteriales bacterium]|nr:hypothetical protein [Flavobacteriales bacterium]
MRLTILLIFLSYGVAIKAQVPPGVYNIPGYQPPLPYATSIYATPAYPNTYAYSKFPYSVQKKGCAKEYRFHRGKIHFIDGTVVRGEIRLGKTNLEYKSTEDGTVSFINGIKVKNVFLGGTDFNSVQYKDGNTEFIFNREINQFIRRLTKTIPSIYDNFYEINEGHCMSNKYKKFGMNEDGLFNDILSMNDVLKLNPKNEYLNMLVHIVGYHVANSKLNVYLPEGTLPIGSNQELALSVVKLINEPKVDAVNGWDQMVVLSPFGVERRMKGIIHPVTIKTESWTKKVYIHFIEDGILQLLDERLIETVKLNGKLFEKRYCFNKDIQVLAHKWNVFNADYYVAFKYNQGRVFLKDLKNYKGNDFIFFKKTGKGLKFIAGQEKLGDMYVKEFKGTFE